MFHFDTTYLRLPERFYARVTPATVRAPHLVRLNRALAETLGADVERLASPEGVEVLAGNVVPEGSVPVALAYAGHQFGVFVPQLGDGRAVLLGEVVGKDGRRRDIQLKGAGRTPFSRGGDGRAALGPVLREYVVSEAMAALGIPTTRALAAVTTGERVVRDQPLPGAVLTRVASSHIRVGTFQYFAARDDREALELLTAHALERHYPEAAQASNTNKAIALVDQVAAAQARLVAQWLGVGFIHGVMNTDNSSISGETIDYGPCAFLDAYDPRKRFSSIDHQGRYAFANQPRIAHWNLVRLAEALLPLLADSDEAAIKVAEEHIAQFPALFEAAYGRVLRAKLGLQSEVAGDRELADDLLQRMASNQVDHTLFFRQLCACAADPAADAAAAAFFADPGAFHFWAESWRRRLAEEPSTPEERAASMRGANPAFIPRNHRIEQAIAAAVVRGDFEPFERLVEVLARPYDEQPEHAALAEPPKVEEQVQATFCGT